MVQIEKVVLENGRVITLKTYEDGSMEATIEHEAES